MAAVQGQASWRKDHIVIASFIGKKIAQHHLADWIQSINRKGGFDLVSFHIDMDRGFLFLETTNIAITRKLLALIPHTTPWGTGIYQEWIPGFNPDNPVGLKIPTWISLVKLPLEYIPV
jgi:hypothetical protein